MPLRFTPEMLTSRAQCPSCKQPAYVYAEGGLRYCQACAYEEPDSAALPALPPDDNHDDPDDPAIVVVDVPVTERPAGTLTHAGKAAPTAGPAAAIGNDALAAARALHERIMRTEAKLADARAELSRLVDMARLAGVAIPDGLDAAAPRRAKGWKRNEQRQQCPECGAWCGSPAGLAVHRKHKHSVMKEITKS